MIEYGGILLAQAAGVLVCSLLTAAILLWRARKRQNWIIPYKDAYVVSLKAGFSSLVIANVAIIAVAYSGIENEDLFKHVALLFGVGAWWFVHTNALLRFASITTTLTVKDAKALSANVFAYQVGGFFVAGFVLAILMVAVSGTK